MYEEEFFNCLGDYVANAQKNAGKKDKLDSGMVKCKICLLEAPAACPKAQICEMCFDTEFEVQSENELL